jgi:hypothetical protein
MTGSNLDLRTVNMIRYSIPLREGGSLPALAEADDGFLYVLKFKGAGQGSKALISEILGGEIARALGLRVPEIVFAMVNEAFGRSEGDEEIQDLLKASTGLNLGLHYLSGSMTFDPVVYAIEPELASAIVWLDALLMNVDRTVRNTNLLMWHKELWLIDHGASLYFHHSWNQWEEQSLKPFIQIKDHVLLPWASELESINSRFKLILTEELLFKIVQLIPDVWLDNNAPFTSDDAHRQAYFQFLVNRVKNSEIFVRAASHARESLI